MITINKTDSIFKIASKHKEILDVMVLLGFKDIVKPGMLQSVGRIMTIEKGCAMKKLNFSEVKETFKKHGYELN